jgi:hypothetical protein
MNRRSALVAVVLVALHAAASADVDVVVGNGDVVSGTIAPATETETFRVTVPKGATLFVKAKALKKGPALSVVVRDPANTSIGARSGKSVSIKTTPLTTTGEYVVQVQSDEQTTTGDYSLVISWKSPTSVLSVAGLAPGASGTLSFGADAGAVATIVAKKSGKASGAVPSLVSLVGPTSSPAVGPGPTAKVTIPDPGEYVLTYANTGAQAGTVAATVKIKPPKPTKSKVALNRAAIGEGGIAGGGAFGSVVPTTGGVVAFPTFPFASPGGPLAGTSVSIPSGALGAPTVVVIATAPPLTPLDAKSGAGPTVFFGPEGTRFDTSDASKRATITIPYDPSFESATGAFVVYTRDAKGAVTAVDPPYAIDHVAHTVTFATSHFSSFRVAAAGGPTDVTMRTVAHLEAPIDFCLASAPPGRPARYKLFVADQGEDTVIGLVTRPGGDLTLDPETFAGNGGSSADGTFRTNFAFPPVMDSVASRSDGTVFAATDREIFRIAANGAVTRYAGSGTSGDTGDEGPARDAKFSVIVSVAADEQGRVFICDFGAHRIRVIDKAGVVHAFSGSGFAVFGPDGVAPGSTTFLVPRRIALAHAGGLFVADAARIRHIDPVAGVNATLAGGPTGATGVPVDGVALAGVRFQAVGGVGTFFDAALQKELVAVGDPQDSTVHLIDAAADQMTFVAGASGVSGDAPDAPGPANVAVHPSAVVVTAEGTYFLHPETGKIRFVNR